MDDKTRTELEAAAFRGLVKHLQKRTDVLNIDLMNLAGFCRNCLSKWYLAAAKERGVPMMDPASVRREGSIPVASGPRMIASPGASKCMERASPQSTTKTSP